MTRASRNPWHFDWDSARWVYLETNIKSRPAYIGFVDEDMGPHVYLLCPLIRNGEGRWIDSWTWREELGQLPHLKGMDPGGYYGEVIVYKWTIKRIKEVDDHHPPEIGRCWSCGKRVTRGRFCDDPGHEAAFRMMGLDQEMI